MKDLLDLYCEVKTLGKVIADHTTTDGFRVFVNIGNKQVVRIDVKLDAKQEVEALLKHNPFFASSGS